MLVICFVTYSLLFLFAKIGGNVFPLGGKTILKGGKNSFSPYFPVFFS